MVPKKMPVNPTVTDNEVNESFNSKQKDHFEIQANIARIEQSIESVSYTHLTLPTKA